MLNKLMIKTGNKQINKHQIMIKKSVFQVFLRKALKKW